MFARSLHPFWSLLALTACTAKDADPARETADTAAETSETGDSASDTSGDSDSGETQETGKDSDTAGEKETGKDSGETGETGSAAPTYVALASDTSWRSTGVAQGVSPPAGWTDPGYDDSSWRPAQAPNDSSCGAEWTVTETWQQPAKPMWDDGDSCAAFFRTHVTVGDPSILTESRISVIADDDIAVWVNGIELYVEADFGKSEDTGFDNQAILGTVELAPALVEGDNVIAIHGLDSCGGCRWAFVSGTISSK